MEQAAFFFFYYNTAKRNCVTRWQQIVVLTSSVYLNPQQFRMLLVSFNGMKFVKVKTSVYFGTVGPR